MRLYKYCSDIDRKKKEEEAWSTLAKVLQHLSQERK